MVVPAPAVPERVVLVVPAGLVVLAGPAALVVRPVPAGLEVRVPPPVPVARPVRICRAVLAAVTIRASRCPVLAFVPVVLVAAPVVLAAAVDPVVVVPAAEAVLAVVRLVRSVSRRASVVVPLRSSLLPQ